ncbi:MAG: N-acetylmuramoyl-L-alanine amidase [Defluviitaleaceae bacterium]|nr:N-acetylmuramoyl-L-alanine amidase [Defluviitaleaceae bacterium]
MQSFEEYESHHAPKPPYRDTYPKIVWLDAGHGGRDTGTYVTLNGVRIYEKDIALDIVLRVYELFRQSDSGVKAFLTRADDSHVQLSHRPNLWNNTPTMVAKADLVVSVHVDYYEGETAQTVSGIQVNYYSNQAQNTGRVDITGGQFAQILQNHLVNETGARDRNIRGDRGFAILAESAMPAVIIETGFMSNSEELAKLMTEAYRMSIARGIYEGIVEAFGSM